MRYVRRLASVSVMVLGGLGSGMSLAQTKPVTRTPVVNGIGDPRSVVQTPSFGTISEQIALALPPGRRNLMPKLSFTYVSTGGLDLAGLGWQLETGHVDRSLQNGVPSFTDADVFSVSVGGSSSELVAVGGGNFRAKFESQYRLATKVGDSWQVVEAQGTVYKFGSTADSKVTDASGTLTATWMLDLIQDTNGNTITFKYRRDHGALYIEEIDYTGYAPTSDPGFYKVSFAYDSVQRPDARKNFASGIEIDRFLRLTGVSIAADSAPVRSYAISYITSPTNGRSLVSSLTLVGSDGTSAITARSYSYQSRTLGWPTTSSGGLPKALNASDGHDPGVRLVDVDGDNFVDLVDNGSAVYRGDGLGGFNLDPTWSSSISSIGVPFVVQVGDNPGLDNGVRLLDVNGDGRPDVVVANLSTHEVFLNTGNGWTLDSAYTASIQSMSEVSTVKAAPDAGVETVPFSIVGQDSDALGVQFADVNGDGLTDIVWSFQITSGFSGTSPLATDAGVAARAAQTIAGVWLNTGSGFTRDNARSSALLAAVPDSFVADTQTQGFDVLDVNGDGLADIIRTLDGADRVVLINTGSAWTEDPDYTASLQAATNIVSLSSDRKSLGLLPVDFNNDGLLDYIRSDSSITVAYKNTGLGWTVDDAMTSSITAFGLHIVGSDNTPTGVSTVDVNGDGIADLVQSRDGGNNAIYLAAGPFPDLLSEVVTALGEKTDLVYAPSSQFPNIGADGLQDLPIVLQVAISLTRNDGRGNALQSGFSYKGGLQQARKLRGFATGTVVDPRGVTQALNFFQDEARIGQIASGQTFDTLGNKRSDKTSTYQLVNPVAGVTQAQLIQLDEVTSDPADTTHPAGTLHTRTRTSYDQFMNVIEVDKDGDVDVTGDEGRTVMQHVQNLSLSIVDPVSRISTYDAAGALVSQTITLYDGLPEGQAIAGNPTSQIESVVIGGATVTRPTTFDQYGNVQTVGDGAGHVITFAYDATTHSFRTSLTDPNGRVIQSSYDLRFGIATSEIDFNGHTQTRALDAFGRLTRETMPGDESSPFGTQTITYGPLGDPATQTIRIDSTTTAGTSNTFATTTFYDGFAQAYRTEAPGESGQTVVQTTEFDDAGNPSQISRPFFLGATPALTNYTRDALRRLTSVTEPDGISHQILLYGTTSDVVDRRGNLTRFVHDAYGKVTEQHQFVSGADQVTTYQYDSVGNPVTITDAAGEVTHIGYDALGRRISLVDPAMGSFSYQYDAAGNLASQIDPDGGKTTFTYDSARQMVKKTLPDGRVIRFVYDLSPSTNTIGRVGRIFDDAGELEIEYDVRGNVAVHRRHIEGQTFVTGYAYDSMSRLRQQIYPDGYTVNFAYNPSGYVGQIVDGSGAQLVTSVSHDASGAITDIKYGNGVDSARTYDLLSRLAMLKTTTSGGTQIQSSQNAYDPVGNVTGISDLAFGRSQTFTYDEKSRISSAIGAYGSESYQYDAVGNLLKKGSILMNDDPSHKQQVTCGIDTSAIPATGPIHTGGGQTTSDDAQFGACVRALQARLTGSDLTAVNTFATAAHPRRLETETTFVASYDHRGNMVQKNDTQYVYDSENHLLQVIDGHQVSEENIYDAAGMRVIRKARPGGPGGTVTVFIDGIFEMGAADTFRHVAIGQMLVASVHRDANIRLVSDVTPGVFAVPLAGSPAHGCACGVGGAPRPLPLGLVVAGALAALLVRSRGGRGRRLWRDARAFGSSAIGAARRRTGRWLIALLLLPTYLLYANGARGDQGGNMSLAPPIDFFYYHLDHVGNVEAISNQQGQVVKRLQYKPFGEQLNAPLTPTQSGFLDLPNDPDAKQMNRSFNGHDFDVTTGLYYFGARHYSPVLGRFLTADTKTEDPANPQTLHRYVFNLNNPIRNIDLTGHSFWDVVLAIVVVVLIVVAVVVVTIGTAGVGDVLFGVAVGVLIGAGVGLAVGVILAYAKYGNLTSAASLRLILATTFAGELIGASVGYIVGAGGLGAAFSANNLADWATHDLIANVLIGAAGGATGAVAGGNPNDPNFGADVFLGTAIGIGTGLIAAASDGLGNIWEPANNFFPPWEQGLFSFFGGATGSFFTANGYVCKKTGIGCVDSSNVTPNTDITTTTAPLVTQSLKQGVPAWSFDGTSLEGQRQTFIGRHLLDVYPLSP